jgi:hypothetical protein
MRLSRRIYPLTGLGVALALALTACGGGSPASSGPPAAAGLTAAQVLAKAGENTAKAESYSFEMQMTATGDTPMEMTGHGRVQADPLAMQMQFTDFSAAGQDMSGMEMRFLENVFYMRIPALSGMIGDAEWLALDTTKLDELTGMGFEDLLAQVQQSDPIAQFKTLLASEDFTEVGAEEINGAPTTHYTGSLDVSKIADIVELDADMRELMMQSYEALGVSKIDYEVWLDDQFLTRKMIMTIPGSAGTQTMTMTVSDYNQPVNIEKPPAGDTVDFQELMNSAG